MLALLVGHEEEHLGNALVGINPGRQGCGIRDLQGDKSLPLGFKGGHIDDDTAAGIRAFR